MEMNDMPLGLSQSVTQVLDDLPVAQYEKNPEKNPEDSVPSGFWGYPDSVKDVEIDPVSAKLAATGSAPARRHGSHARKDHGVFAQHSKLRRGDPMSGTRQRRGDRTHSNRPSCSLSPLAAAELDRSFALFDRPTRNLSDVFSECSRSKESGRCHLFALVGGRVCLYRSRPAATAGWGTFSLDRALAVGKFLTWLAGDVASDSPLPDTIAAFYTSDAIPATFKSTPLLAHSRPRGSTRWLLSPNPFLLRSTGPSLGAVFEATPRQHQARLEASWQERRPRAFFRGTDRGPGTPRLELATLSASVYNSTLDVRVSPALGRKAADYNPRVLARSKTPSTERLKYRYGLPLDGGAAGQWEMYQDFGSSTVLWRPRWDEFWTTGLQDGEHFVGWRTAADADRAVRRLEATPARAIVIAANGYAAARSQLHTVRHLGCYMQHLLHRYARLMRAEPAMRAAMRDAAAGRHLHCLPSDFSNDTRFTWDNALCGPGHRRFRPMFADRVHHCANWSVATHPEHPRAQTLLAQLKQYKKDKKLLAQKVTIKTQLAQKVTAVWQVFANMWG